MDERPGIHLGFCHRAPLHSFHEHSGAELTLFAFLMTEVCWLRRAKTTESCSTRCGARCDHATGGPYGWVFGLAFAPDDKTLVSTSWDGTIRFWSLANYQVALMLTHEGGAGQFGGLLAGREPHGYCRRRRNGQAMARCEIRRDHCFSELEAEGTMKTKSTFWPVSISESTSRRALHFAAR